MISALRAPLRRAAVQASRSVRASAQPAARQYSTAPAAKSNAGLWIGLGAAVAAGGGYYLYSKDLTPAEAGKEAATAGKTGVAIAKNYAGFKPTKEDYQKVYNRIAEIMEVDGYDDNSYGPVLVRLAWHSSGTYDKETNTGGSNYATMRFAPESLHAANNGLNVARAVLQKVHDEFPWISYGDLWTLGGVAAIQEMGGPKVPWRPGRIDGFDKDVTPDGRLPDATKAQDHLRHIFYRMGFNDQEIVALSGAHALGRCHPDRSGFEGPWTFSPTSVTNEYFKLLLDEKWVWRKWNGPAQYQDKKTGTLMMLPSDFALVQDKKFKEWVVKYAKDEELFFNDFSKVIVKLFELGVPEKQWATEPWIMDSA
ncbi:peroxidase [Tulasnella calospora MUT 4182]|uniref:Peroxidase n=1 Tax=Tulasnella calospora MUT 4182 TaxID=1051891 RepID=A0A0C3KUX7_9AGAM|nr:peroxidase [Tulasnella calospora MUT 4182]